MPVRCVSSEVDATIRTCSGRSPTSTSLMCAGRPCSMRSGSGRFIEPMERWAAPFSRERRPGTILILGLPTKRATSRSAGSS